MRSFVLGSFSNRIPPLKIEAKLREGEREREKIVYLFAYYAYSDFGVASLLPRTPPSYRKLFFALQKQSAISVRIVNIYEQWQAYEYVPMVFHERFVSICSKSLSCSVPRAHSHSTFVTRRGNTRWDAIALERKEGTKKFLRVSFTDD